MSSEYEKKAPEEDAENVEDQDGCEDVITAVVNGSLKAVKYFYMKDQNCIHATTDNGSTMLYLACLEGHKDICQFLLAKGADHDDGKGGVTPLMLASKLERTEIEKFLQDSMSKMS